MKEDTYEHILDAIMNYLYRAYENSCETDNLRDAFKFVVEILKDLENRFGNKKINFDAFMKRLERDEFVRIFNDATEGTLYRLTPQGIDFVVRGDSYVEIENHKKRKTDLEVDLLESQNRNSRWQKKWGNPLIVSNIVIAISGVIASGGIAIYLNKAQKAPVNVIEIVIDSNFLRKYPYHILGNQNNDRIKQSSLNTNR